MNFRSDNTASMHPKILEYLSREVGKHDKSYGSDASTQKLHLLLADIFETEVAVFPVTTGTAANALALAAITPRCSAIACHKGAHIFTDECAAPGFFCDSSPLIPIEGKNGKIGLDSLQSICELFSENDPQCSPVKTLSITQATEHGTIYSLAELEALSNFANANDIRLHMDGARFANYRNRLA